MARSKLVLSSGISPGARLTVIRFRGSSSWVLLKAPRSRSFAPSAALFAKPTITIPDNPLVIWHSTSITMPSNLEVMMLLPVLTPVFHSREPTGFLNYSWIIRWVVSQKENSLCEKRRLFSWSWIFFEKVLIIGFWRSFFLEQRLARSRCYRDVFVFEHFFYSSAKLILYIAFLTVNRLMINFLYKTVHNYAHHNSSDFQRRIQCYWMVFSKRNVWL